MSILIVTGIEGARNCAAVVGAQLGLDVEVAEGRKAALAALRRKEFLAVVVDETMAECDPAAAEAIWEHAGLAIPLQINFALSGAARLTREIRSALRRQEFLAVVVDETMAECDPAAAETIWEHAGLAIPLQINFALSGAARLTREIRSALHRREREQTLARRAAAAAIETELKSTVAGLLLHSQLALSGTETSTPLAEKLRVVADLAGSLRQQLSVPLEVRGNTAA